MNPTIKLFHLLTYVSGFEQASVLRHLNNVIKHPSIFYLANKCKISFNHWYLRFALYLKYCFVILFFSGAAFTRFQTLRLKRVFPEVLSEQLISYGSCQFPTLGFVVERYKQVQDFIQEPFWKIKGIVKYTMFT